MDYANDFLTSLNAFGFIDGFSGSNTDSHASDLLGHGLLRQCIQIAGFYADAYSNPRSNLVSHHDVYTFEYTKSDTNQNAFNWRLGD